MRGDSSGEVSETRIDMMMVTNGHGEKQKVRLFFFRKLKTLSLSFISR